MNPSTPARTIWSYRDHFDFHADIGPGHPFHTELQRHRGDYSRQRMLTVFNLAPDGSLRPGTRARESEAVLFGGHVGCGKSTELRDYERLFAFSYTVRRLELSKLLNVHNLRFSDMLLAIAQSLVGTFIEGDLSLRPDPVFVDPVLSWFETRIVKQERFKELEGEVRTEAKVGAGLPWLGSLLATLVAKVRGGASYSEELRREIRDDFNELAHHFAALVGHANTLLRHQQRGPLLFLLDGTDKLSPEDAQTLFGGDVNQLLEIRTNLVICAPISVLLEVAGAAQRFQRIQLPMVKIFDADESPRPEDEQALIDLVTKRMPLTCFDDVETVRHLVRMSGGHVRDLLRLVLATFSRLEGDAPVIDRAIADRAARDLASEAQRWVTKDDWADLVRIDASHGDDKDRTPERLRMLYDLVLLEYNSYWWRSHPLLRLLPAYAKARAALGAGSGAAA